MQGLETKVLCPVSSYDFDRVVTFFDHCIPDMRSFDMQINDFIDRSGFIPPYADSDQPYYQYEEGEYEKYLLSYKID